MKTFLNLASRHGSGFTCSLFSPASQAADSMTTAASISDARLVHNAALLADGRVLVAGGGVTDTIADGGVTLSTQVFDPVTGAWSNGDFAFSAAREGQQRPFCRTDESCF
jgi:hypothetical protein